MPAKFRGRDEDELDKGKKAEQAEAEEQEDVEGQVIRWKRDEEAGEDDSGDDKERGEKDLRRFSDARLKVGIAGLRSSL